MEPRLSLRCLGEPILAGPDGEPVRFKVRKHLALLVYLAVESRGRHHRDHLADLLWANLPENDGRHSLATALSMIRAKVGPDALETDRDHVRFACSRVEMDLTRLESGDVLASEFQPALAIAGFLDGFEVPGSAEFMLWRERQRSRWLPLVREALIKRIDKCRRTGDFKQIEHLADRMLDLDELSEEAVRAKMEARAFAGDRLTALKVFEAWKERLEEDLGAAPSALVDGMALRLRRRGWERPSSPIAAVHTDHWKNRAFVGRAVEYQALYEAWERTRAGQAGHMLILGDSGIGKTTLADRLATAAGLEGAVASRVQCYDIEREIPYAAVSGLVHGLLDRPGASATPPEALAELARTMPEVRVRFPAIPQAADSQGETARILLTEAFHQFLSALADEQPVILVVDDLHLADDASLAVLHLMMRRAVGQPIMVVFASRGEGFDQSPQAARLRESTVRLGIRTVELARMTDAESAELLTSLIPEGEEQPGIAARRALLRAAAGYPMVLELLVQDWQSNGERSLALSVEAMTADPAAGGGPVESYRLLLDRITHGLDPATRNVLNLAAILGSRLNDIEAYALADLSLGQAMSGMGVLLKVRIFRETGNGLEFVNELMRAQVYVAIPSPLRHALHREIAGRLLEDERAGHARSGLEIAWHCFRGGYKPEGVTHLLTGARQALGSGAPHEVELALKSAMTSLEPTDAVAAQVLLAESMQEQGRWVDSLEVMSGIGAARTSQQAGMLQIMAITAHQQLLDIDSDNVSEILDTLEAFIQHAPNSDLKVRALESASLILNSLQRAESVQRFTDLAGTLVEENLREEDRPRLFLARLMLLAQSRQSEAAFDTTIEIVNRLPASESGNALSVQLQLCCSAVHCFKGQYRDAIPYALAAHRGAARLGNDQLAASAAGNVALCHCRLGNYDEQLKWSQLGLSALGQAFTGIRDVQLGYGCAFAHAMLHDSTAALEQLSRTGARLPMHTPEWIVQAWRLHQADVFQLVGRTKDARDRAKQAIASGRPHSAAYAGPFARWLALEGSPAESVAAQLKSLARDMSRYDKMDQAEILAADAWLRRRIGAPDRMRGVIERRLAEQLAALPEAVATQLNRLGVLATTELA